MEEQLRLFHVDDIHRFSYHVSHEGSEEGR